MKTCSAGLITFLANATGSTPCWRCDLVTLTLVDGTTVYRWTTADFDVTYGGNTYLAGGGGSAPIIKRGSYKQSSQLTIDTFDVTLCGPFVLTTPLGSQQLGAAALTGYFDGARVRVDHLIGAYPGDTSLGSIDNWFEGPVSQPDPQGADLVLHCKSQLELLNLQLPRFLIGPQCGNAVYDANCTIVKTTWTDAGTVASATTGAIVASAGIVTSKPDNYYNLGVLRMTSGALSGQWRAVADFVFATSTIVLALPFATAPAVGATFSVYPGCDRSKDTCLNRFNNQIHFRGYPRIPRPEAGGGA